MGDVNSAALGSQLRLLFEAGAATGLSDRHLLEMFVTRRDEGAFAALLHRHGPMVQRICHDVLGDHHDAQDAFQATFLILARSARSIRQRDSVASWLCGVAPRVAAGARSASIRRRQHERNWAALPAVATESGSENQEDLGAHLHEEIGRLPERFRAPVVLCYLEGRTYEEVAQVLKCPVEASELIVYAEQWAPRRVSVAAGGGDLGDVRLEAGVELSGQLVMPTASVSGEQVKDFSVHKRIPGRSCRRG